MTKQKQTIFFNENRLDKLMDLWLKPASPKPPIQTKKTVVKGG